MDTRARIIAALTFLFDQGYVAEGDLFQATRQENGTELTGWWFQPPDDQPFFVGHDEYEALALGVVGPMEGVGER